MTIIKYDNIANIYCSYEPVFIQIIYMISFIYLILVTLNELNTIVIPILQIWKLRLRGSRYLHLLRIS